MMMVYLPAGKCAMRDGEILSVDFFPKRGRTLVPRLRW